MFEKILIANRGDQPAMAGAAAQLNCAAATSRKSDYTEVAHV
ncbi:MAG TPA: hypothetical protein VGK09_02920 [Rhodocyclaceae bacterium]|jgi:hypothetical protein